MLAILHSLGMPARVAVFHCGFLRHARVAPGAET